MKDHSENTTDKKVVHTVKQQLNLQAEQLDQNTTAALDKIRRNALAAANNKNTVLLSQWPWKRVFAPILAAIIALAVFINIERSPTSPTTMPPLATNDLNTEFELVANNEDFELMEEEIEFYLWLEENTGTG